MTSWHYVQSEIEDRKVTYCGRQMHNTTTKGKLKYTAHPESDTCFACPYVDSDPDLS